MPLLCPLPYLVLNGPNGVLPGWRLNTYAAGTSSPRATFTDATGAVANPNPVIADAQGRMTVWLDEMASYRLLLTDAAGQTVLDVDNVQGVGSGSGAVEPSEADEWLAQSDSPTFVSATQFSVPGNLVSVYHVGRRMRIQLAAQVGYGTITASAFATGVTTVTMNMDSVPIDSGISALSVGINSADNPSISSACISDFQPLAVVPTGGILPFGGAVAPAGYLLCDGSVFDGTTTYPELYAVIGNTFGGTTSSDAQVPDLRGRSPIGFGQSTTGEAGALGTAYSIGDQAGAETHTLTQGELPAHAHTTVASGNNTSVNTGSGAAGGSVLGGVTGSVGSDEPHNNQSPVLAVGYIIKT